MLGCLGYNRRDMHAEGYKFVKYHAMLNMVQLQTTTSTPQYLSG